MWETTVRRERSACDACRKLQPKDVGKERAIAYTNLFAPYQQPWTQPFSAQPQLPQVPQVPQVQPFAAQQPAPQAQQPNAMEACLARH